MNLPFSVDQFYGVFRAYNEALWPFQLLPVGLAIVAIILVLRPRRGAGAIVSGILAFLWAWLALAYHFVFFADINPLAYVFAGFSLAGAVVFFWHGVVRRRLHFSWTGSAGAYAGAALVVFALVVYPAWSWYAGHGYPAMPTFGVPCPTTIFTIGLLAFLVPPYPRGPFVVPILWCLVGVQAAFLLGVHQDTGLIAAGLVGAALLVRAGTGTSRFA